MLHLVREQLQQLSLLHPGRLDCGKPCKSSAVRRRKMRTAFRFERRPSAHADSRRQSSADQQRISVGSPTSDVAMRVRSGSIRLTGLGDAMRGSHFSMSGTIARPCFIAPSSSASLARMGPVCLADRVSVTRGEAASLGGGPHVRSSHAARAVSPAPRSAGSEPGRPPGGGEQRRHSQTPPGLNASTRGRRPNSAAR